MKKNSKHYTGILLLCTRRCTGAAAASGAGEQVFADAVGLGEGFETGRTNRKNAFPARCGTDAKSWPLPKIGNPAQF